MKTKDQALEMLKIYKNRSENQTNITIKEIFTDNGKEYINSDFAIYIRKYGIIHRKTPIYTKEPNGLIERINLTLLNKLRSLLIYSKTSQFLWGEALLAAVYIYNRTPHRALQFKTPYEIYKGVSPKIDHIKIWGSIAYYHTNKHLPKLLPRKNIAILVGYSDYMHYKLYDIKLRQTIWTRDAVIIGLMGSA
jgi:transposase InsO family protein